MAIQGTSAYGGRALGATVELRGGKASTARAKEALPAPFGIGTWLVVVLVGALVLGLVFGLSLFPRLDAGQRVINRLRPAFTPARVAGDQAAIQMVSTIVNTLDPIMTTRGGAAAEVPQLVGFLSAKTGLSDAAVVAALKSKFPAVAHLLLALPLSSVTAEIPGLVSFLATTLHATPAQVLAALKANFPALTQSIVNLPAVTNGWNNVPGATGLTRLNGSAVHTVPQIRDYFADDVIPTIAANQANFGRLADWFPPVWFIPLLLTIVGALVVLFGLLMVLLSWRRRVDARMATAAWGVVTAVGVLVLVVVFPFQLFARLDGGQRLLNSSAPLFTPARISGDVAGINIISSAVNTFNPVMNPQGGGSAEVPKLVAFLAAKTGRPASAVLALMGKTFPAVTNLLEAIPLTSVTAELPGLVSFLESTLHATSAQVASALQTDFPAITQAITNLPLVTQGWDNVPGTAALSRFDGSPVRTVPQVRDYFKDDLIPAAGASAADFHTLSAPVPALTVFAPILTIVGVVVVIYGVVLLLISRRFGRFLQRLGSPYSGGSVSSSSGVPS
ncbi:MAG: hypothetical protein ABSH30_06965 [Acidimicrobiales bacterium]